MKDIAHIPSTCVMQTLRSAARAVTGLYEAELRKVDLTASQFSAMVAIASAKGETVNGLAGHLGMDRTTLTRVLGPLERRSLVEIGADERDRRARVPTLTPQGKTLLREAADYWNTAQAEALHRLGGSWREMQQTLGKL